MATLFFDGFDRGTALGRLDPQYWSTQYRNAPGYALGGYSYDHNNTNYSSQYKTISINNGTLPSVGFSPSADHNVYWNYWNLYQPGSRWRILAGNNYPGFGTPPGFLSLSNIPINDTNFLAPLTYIQLSGFPQPQGNKSYFGARFLGLETKHTDYDSRIDSFREDKPGRFDYRHPLLAFCSGNTTGILISVIKATGNNLTLLDNEKMTMGLQVEQNGSILGVFDLNMNDTINNYKLTSVYNNKIWDRYFAQPTLFDENLTGKVLTLCKFDSTEPTNNGQYEGSVALCSRWTHIEFLIDNSSSGPYIAAQIEGVDIPIIDIDDTNSDKSTWLLELPISGFKYDNIRFFNRTYYPNLTTDIVGADPSYSPYRPAVFNSGTYYMKGAVTLIDDVTLIDNVGQPGTWLGPTSKVIPLSPGVNSNLDNNGNITDGLREWTTNSSSHRRAMKNFDGDIGVLETTISGAITAVRYDNNNFGADSASTWRTQFNDGIAGIKVYNTARKNFLDTAFTNVFFTGISDTRASYTKLLINTDRDIYDVTNTNTLSKIEPILLSYGTQKFDDPSIFFPGTDSFLYTTYGPLHRSESSNSFPYPHPDNFFTIESWVYFQNGKENITLYGKKPPTSYPQIADLRLDIPLTNFDIVCTTGYIQYSTYIDDILLGYRRLYFPSPIATGTWNHVAVVSDAIQDFRGSLVNNTRYYNHQYRLISYLNGISGTSFESWNSLDSDLSVYTTNDNPYGWFPLTNSYSDTINLDFGSNISGLRIASVIEQSLVGLGNNVSPLTGIFDEYFPTIGIPTAIDWIDMTVVPTSIVFAYDNQQRGWSNFAENPHISGNYTIKGFYNAKPYWQQDGTTHSIYWGKESASNCPFYWTVKRNLGGNLNNGDIAGQNPNNTLFPPTAGFTTRGDYCWGSSWNTPGPAPFSLQYNTTQPTPLSITETRCNNKLAYLVTSAASPDMTGLYCYGGIHRNAYYYVNTNNSIYYLSNTDQLYGDNNSSRRWVLSSGLFDPTIWNVKYVAASESPSPVTIFNITSLAEAHAKISINLQNNSNSNFVLYKNNISQYNLSSSSNGMISGIIPVVSGDSLSLIATYNYSASPDVSIGAPSMSLFLSLGSPVQNGIYNLPTEWVDGQIDQYNPTYYFTRPFTIVGRFLDDYTNTSLSNNKFPLFIGGGGHIDNYRFTHGTSYVAGVQSRGRYWQDFIVSDSPFPSVYDDYYQVGETHNLTRTRYNTIQYFAMNNPATQQPWTIDLIETSGFLFGVKKL